MSAVKWILSIFLCLLLVFVAIFGVNCVYGYLFPLKFQAEVAAASEESGLDEALIFSVINIESRFNPNAVSPKGAVGLMQVLPSTAKTLTVGDEIDLKNPATNISLGAKYLAQLLSRFENLDTALCAYNAGPTTVKNWLSNPEYSADGKMLSLIPYEETRNYLQKFHKNLKYYSAKVK